MGKPAFFIRTYGCPLHCPWCDAAGTWHKDHIPDHIERFTARQLANEASSVLKDYGMVVITGGEPAIHDLGPLCNALNAVNLDRHLETSGSFPVKGCITWMTLSPKKWKKPLKENVIEASEFKFIIEQPDDIYFYEKMVRELSGDYHDWEGKIGGTVTVSPPIWLHPEWSQRDNPLVLSAISEAVKEQRAPFRAGWQIHKCYHVDQADERSRPQVPLGGDPKKGF